MALRTKTDFPKKDFTFTTATQKLPEFPPYDCPVEFRFKNATSTLTLIFWPPACPTNFPFQFP